MPSVTYPTPDVRVFASGVGSPRARLDVRSVVLPASYVANGHPVDLSGAFSSLLAVLPGRVFTTATGVAVGRIVVPAEVGTDVFASGKFRLMVFDPRATFTPAGTVGAPVFTGIALGTHTHTSLSVGCDGQNHVAGLCFTNVMGGAVSAGTPAGTNSAPAFTGTAVPASEGAEVAALTDLSALSVELLVVGVPV